VNCHDHDNEKLWSEKKDGPPPNNHLNALKQMESPKSAGYAKAVGLTADQVYDAVVLKVLGATRARLGAVYAIEYGLLGTLAGLAALGAGSAAACGVATFVLDLPFVFAARAVAFTIVGGALGTLVLGLAGGFAALSAKPASRLRNP
jgi:predicted lysophospholipase L1 biosynthesis ABC-type transport system permease subunit